MPVQFLTGRVFRSGPEERAIEQAGSVDEKEWRLVNDVAQGVARNDSGIDEAF